MNTDKQFEEMKKDLKNKERFIRLTPRTKIGINEWRNILNDNFPDLAFAAEAGLSVIAQLLIEDIKNPFALVYVDVPSSGKTVTLNFFSTIKELVFTADDFTPASFVSHAANKNEKALEKIDLLPKIRYKTLMVRDMAPIFAKRDEDVQAMLGILIRVLDGEGFESASGVHGKRGYSGDYLFMLLSASTPIRPRIWKVMGNLGSRLFFFNIDGAEKDEIALANQLKTSCRDKEIVCREATEEFVKTLWSKYPQGIIWDKEKDDLSFRQIIARLAKVLAKLRSPINVWEDSTGQRKQNHTQIMIEMPDRLNQLLYNVTRGHALIYGRENIAQEDLVMTIRVALDSALPNRSKIFKHLIRRNGELTTSYVMEILKCSRPTALKLMKEMTLLKITNKSGDLNDESHYDGKPEEKIIIKDEYAWFISDECKKLMKHSVRNGL